VNPNVSLSDELANFVTSEVAAARYSSSSEVVREALRLMEKSSGRKPRNSGSCVTHGRKESTAATPARLTYRSRSSPIGASPSRSRKGDR
jgi:putative addiction module CopG family antidote